MRVLLVSPRADPRWLSMERYATRLQLMQPEIEFRPAGVSHFNPPQWARPLIARYRDERALRADAARDADVVHITDGPLAHHRRVFRGRCVVATCHDLIPLQYEGHFPAGAKGLLRGQVYRHGVRALRDYSTLIAVSEATKVVMRDVLGIDAQRVSVVPVGVPHEFSPVGNARESLHSAGIALPSGPLLLSVGHPGQTKNLSMLLAAMADPALTGAHLVRVGAPLSFAHRERIAASGVAGRVHELGSVTDEVLIALYSACDALVQPSFYEGFGIPVAEAMACGLPVVCSEIPALVEVTGGAAVAVPLHGAPRAPVDHDDAKALAAAIASVLNDAAFADRLRSAGLTRAAAFRPEAVAPLLREAYSRAIERGVG